MRRGKDKQKVPNVRANSIPLFQKYNKNKTTKIKLSGSGDRNIEFHSPNISFNLSKHLQIFISQIGRL